MVRGRERGLLVGAARSVDTEPVAEPRDHPRLVLRDPVAARDRRAWTRRPRRTPRTPRPCRAPASRRGPRAPAEGPSGRGSRTARRPRRGARRRSGRSSRGRPGSRGRDPSGRMRGHAIEKRKASSPSSRIKRTSSRPSVVRVAGDRARVAVHDVPGHVAEAIPDALAAAVLAGRSLDLVGGRGRAPDEVGREVAVRCRAVSCRH